MKSILNIISHILTAAFGILIMPVLTLGAVIYPIIAFCDVFKIISSGYTVTGDYFGTAVVLTMLLYFSLRVRAFRRIYVIFPSLYEFVRYLVISYMFIGTGVEILNWSYMEFTTGRRLLGIGAFIISLILWRGFVSFYYSKKPISKVMFEEEEKLDNYKASLN